MRTPSCRIFIVEDHPIVRRSIVSTIQESPHYEICGEADNLRSALKGIASLAPDLVILDLSLKGPGGLELLKTLRIRHPRIPALVLSMHDETLFAERCLHAGARGYVMKSETVSELAKAIERVNSGHVYVSPAMSDRFLESLGNGSQPGSGSPVDRLSDRQLEVFELIGRGQTVSAIAKQLSLSVKTVETHRAHIKEKLGIPNATKLIQIATNWAHGH